MNTNPLLNQIDTFQLSQSDSLMTESQTQKRKAKNDDNGPSKSQKTATKVCARGVETEISDSEEINSIGERALCVFLDKSILCIGKDRLNLRLANKGLCVRINELLTNVFEIFNLKRWASFCTEKNQTIVMASSFLRFAVDSEGAVYKPQDLTHLEIAKFFHSKYLNNANEGNMQNALSNYLLAAKQGSLEALNVLETCYQKQFNDFSYTWIQKIELCQTLGNIYITNGELDKAEARFALTWKMFQMAVNDSDGHGQVQQFYDRPIGGKTSEKVNMELIKALDNHIENFQTRSQNFKHSFYWLQSIFSKEKLPPPYEEKRVQFILGFVLNCNYKELCQKSYLPGILRSLSQLLKTILKCDLKMNLSPDNLTVIFEPENENDYNNLFSFF